MGPGSGVGMGEMTRVHTPRGARTEAPTIQRARAGSSLATRPAPMLRPPCPPVSFDSRPTTSEQRPPGSRRASPSPPEMTLAASTRDPSADDASAAAPPAPEAAGVPARRSLAAAVWDHDRWVLSIMALFIGGSAVLGPLIGWAGVSEWREAYVKYAVFPFVIGLLAIPVRLFLHRQHAPRDLAVGDAWRWAWRRARSRELAGERLASAALIVALLPAFGIVFTAWKATIPMVQPFQWDRALAAADRALHGGVDPWRLLIPIYDRPALVRAIDEAYVLWFVPTMVIPPLVAWAPYSPLRQRFLLTFLVSWIVLGVGVAMLFSSAGPVYYHWATGSPIAENPFHPMMERLWWNLDPEPLRAVRIHGMLFGAQSDPAMVGRGISAFPSLHVGITVVYAIAGWYVSRFWGVVATAFALVTLLGSVVLGWHYAIDGYAGALGVAVIWWASGRLLRRRREVMDRPRP